MDVNGTRFWLLLGEADWGSCRADLDGGPVVLQTAWRAPRDSTAPVNPLPLAWDGARQELGLRARRPAFKAAPADRPVNDDDRRGAGIDRYGNIYWIDATRTRVLVRSAGSGNVSEFWSATLSVRRKAHGDFEDSRAVPPAGRLLSGLAVTEDHYLAVGCKEPAALLVFDLMAGGLPVEMLWPASIPFEPFDLAARPGCGVWILDRVHRRYWGLDRRFGAVSAGQNMRELAASETVDFQPAVTGELRERAAVVFPEGISLEAASPLEAADPIAIDALPGGEVLILDRRASRTSVLCYRDGRRLRAGEDADDLGPQGHDFTFVPGKKGGANALGRLFVASSEGNQAFAFDLRIEADELRLSPAIDFYPMRRFAGRALISGKDQVFYDCVGTWVQLIQQRGARFDEAATLFTPIFDGEEPQCVWHRLMLDACIAPGTSVEVWSRASDSKESLQGTRNEAGSEWVQEPVLYLRGAGAELPWAKPWENGASQNKREDRDGTWELLFQRARGRFLQLKLVLLGNGRATPRLRTLRAWFPRFSYLERFFPALYRENAESASFFERFLANFEGYYTGLEDKIASVQALFDARSAPPEALDWLVDWFGVALDPAWDERRQRLFIRHAMDFFRYRGTVHGLKMVLHLAFDPKIDEDVLGPPIPDSTSLNDIRIVENYLLRRAPSVVFGEPDELSGPREVSAAGPWTPAEGNAGLVRRYATLDGRTPSSAEEATPFSLVPPPGDAAAKKWKVFLQDELGFVPSGGSEEQTRWQKYLASQFSKVQELNTRYHTAYQKFADIALPSDEPGPGQNEDWQAFMMSTANFLETLERSQWQDFLARRYRRVEALNDSYGTHRSSFVWIPQPDRLPADGPALADWFQFERQVKPISGTAHRFRVLLPTPAGGIDPARAKMRMDLAQRIVDLEKPAHTVFDVRFYWAMFRIGDARLGLDTLLDVGSRAPQLLPDVVLGQGIVGSSFVGAAGPGGSPGRKVLAC